MNELTEFLMARLSDEMDTLEHVMNHLERLDHRPGSISFEGRDIYDARRVQAGIEARLRIVAMHFERSTGRICNEDEDLYPCEHLRLLALPYADHPDHRDEWRPVSDTPPRHSNA